MDTNKKHLKTSITEEVLRLKNIIKENLDPETLEVLEDKMSEIDSRYLELDEKKWETLKKDEEKAVGEENFAELVTIRQGIIKVVTKLIAAYKKKLEYLEKYLTLLQNKNKDTTTQGSKVFSNKEINEFKNEDFKKGQTLQLNTNSYNLKISKVSDEANQWHIVSSTIPGTAAQDIVTLPVEVKIGGSAAIKVYRKFKDRYEEIASTTLENITKIIKNPS